MHRVDPARRRARRGGGARGAGLPGAALDRRGAGLARSSPASRTSACCPGCSPSPRCCSGWSARGGAGRAVGGGLDCAVGCGFTVVCGVWAIWSRQVNVPQAAPARGLGLVLAVIAMVMLTASLGEDRGPPRCPLPSMIGVRSTALPGVSRPSHRRSPCGRGHRKRGTDLLTRSRAVRSCQVNRSRSHPARTRALPLCGRPEAVDVHVPGPAVDLDASTPRRRCRCVLHERMASTQPVMPAARSSATRAARQPSRRGPRRRRACRPADPCAPRLRQ